MWDRQELKTKAKESLKRYYWVGFLVMLIFTLIGGRISNLKINNLNSYNSEYEYNYDYNQEYNYNIIENTIETLKENFPNVIFILSLGIIILVIILMVILAISVVWSAFIVNPIEVGVNKFFILNRNEQRDIDTMFSVFNSGKYLNVVKAMFLKDLYVFLWGLLFVIPGIIKRYEYYMVPYIMSENPEIDVKHSFELSKQMTKGNKWNIFVLEISFIGWYILASIVSTIILLNSVSYIYVLLSNLIVVFILPYVEATRAELYMYLRQKAIINGYLYSEELNNPDYDMIKPLQF